MHLSSTYYAASRGYVAPGRRPSAPRAGSRREAPARRRFGTTVPSRCRPAVPAASPRPPAILLSMS